MSWPNQKRKQPLWDSDKLRKEEVRGLFAIGVIAIFVSLKVFVPTGIYFLIPSPFEFVRIFQTDVYIWLITFWSAYLFFMAFALGDDILSSFSPRFEAFSELSRDVAHLLFSLGIVLIVGVALAVFWPLVLFFVIVRYIGPRIHLRKRKQKILS